MGSKPSTPEYDVQQSHAEQQRINEAAGKNLYFDVESPMGGYQIVTNPDGTRRVVTTLSQPSASAQTLQQGVLNTISSDPTEAANKYYETAMTYLQPQLDKQVQRAEASLTNRGIPVGSQAWNEAMGEVYDAQNQIKSQVAGESIFKGQDYTTGQISQAGALGSQVYNPLAAMVAGQGATGLSDTYAAQFQNEMDRYNAEMASRNSLIGGGMGLAGKLGGAIIGNLLAPGVGGAVGSAVGGALTQQ